MLSTPFGIHCMDSSKLDGLPENAAHEVKGKLVVPRRTEYGVKTQRCRTASLSQSVADRSPSIGLLFQESGGKKRSCPSFM